jgi:inositol-phosphate phosphatase / L-galactose 1-phosphate phosphatase / histidinol-phosphatase
MRALIHRTFPDHGVFGEEEGLEMGDGEGGSKHLWVLDPIDGTKSFITGGAQYSRCCVRLVDLRAPRSVHPTPLLLQQRAVLGSQWR